ncbi:uncharacterized protein MELLADRAFT_109165 [Melampsora larici-populina 98AG31]|uniref:Tet-like 2OG-Fe(II) oxygenase domain-containing protein n=1 Tax=Melampsora larici-populina (strain 98AG31 / pathotype 3-4-7) TaxID=747676 RepID=F4RVJ0_MELLP|nr:uncharacterized protein MELLADRAFT_109165 [Melampsora larici-populina 98AG31]EGG03629.1 hypothetical protein MELLADRAFT_109165 [Melampsora larici-populina 98AG31]
MEASENATWIVANEEGGTYIINEKDVAQLPSSNVSLFTKCEKEFTNKITKNEQQRDGWMGGVGMQKCRQDDETAVLEDLYIRRFKDLAEPILITQQDLMHELNTLSFRTLDHEDGINPDGYGGNLTFTLDQFCGVAHTDHDVQNSWSQGLFFPANKEL